MFSGTVSEIIWVMVLSNILLTSSQDRCLDGSNPLQQLKKVPHQSASLEFLIAPKNASSCLGQTARLPVFFLGDNFTQVYLYKDHASNGSAQQNLIDGKKYHRVAGEEKNHDDYYLYICDLTLEDIGWYNVELRNSIGHIARKAFVNVIVCSDINQPFHSASMPPIVTNVNPLLAQSEIKASRHTIFVVLGLLVIVVGVVVTVLCCCLRQTKGRRGRRRRQNEVVHVNPIYNQIPAPFPSDVIVLPMSDPFGEIHPGVEDLLGEGAFEKVYRGAYVGPNCPCLVAIKMLKDRTDFVKEIEMMKTIGRHRNIICFYGYSITQDGCIQVVVEFAKHGNLRDFLRRLKPATVDYETDFRIKSRLCPNGENDEATVGDTCGQRGKEDGGEVEGQVYLTPVESGEDAGSAQRLSFPDLISFCFQVARGMEYLSSRKIIHRDLAARNILVADNGVLKIADFGLTRNTEVRNYYQRSSSGLLPVMWMAPESLADNRYTTRSDVWSFGVLLWEIFSFGADPYSGIPPEELLDRLLQGFRMDKPEFCSDQVAEIIWRCWELSPINRPDFNQLVRAFDRFVTSSTSVQYLSLEHLAEEYNTDNDDVIQADVFSCQPVPNIRLQGQSSADSQYASLSSPSHSRTSSSFADNGRRLVPESTETGSMFESDRFILDSVSTL